jgi:hypothetical protein
MNINGPEQITVSGLTPNSNPFVAFLLLLGIIPLGNHFYNFFFAVNSTDKGGGSGANYFGVRIIDYYIQVNYKDLKVKVTLETATKAQRRNRCIALLLL